MEIIPDNDYIIKGQVIFKVLCIIVFLPCTNYISNENMSKESELIMTKNGELTGLVKTVELYYKSLDLWNIL